MTLDAVTKRDSMRAAVSCRSWFRCEGGGIHDEQDALLSVADNAAQETAPEIITFTRYHMRLFSLRLRRARLQITSLERPHLQIKIKTKDSC